MLQSTLTLGQVPIHFPADLIGNIEQGYSFELLLR